MHMKTISLFFSMMLLVICMSACKGGPTVSKATGSPGDLIVVMEKSSWTGPAGLALKDLLSSDVPGLTSPKRITVSTIGVAKGLQRFLKESDCHLAYSLHSPFPDERLSIMPVEKAFPAKEVIAQIRQFDFSHQRRVSFEYIMFDGLNDDLRHAEGVAKLIAGIPCRVNLIRFHAIPNSPLKSSNTDNMNAFRDTLTKKGIVCTIRSSRGEDIFAACGMLSTSKKEQKN